MNYTVYSSCFGIKSSVVIHYIRSQKNPEKEKGGASGLQNDGICGPKIGAWNQTLTWQHSISDLLYHDGSDFDWKIYPYSAFFVTISMLMVHWYKSFRHKNFIWNTSLLRCSLRYKFTQSTFDSVMLSPNHYSLDGKWENCTLTVHPVKNLPL